jgi:hypothetical protein
METAEHQEWRARQQFSPGAAFKAAFGAGLIFYYMSGGSPWSTAGTMNMIMGRDIPVSLVIIFFAHFAVSFIYTYLIGYAIYRLPTAFAVPAGVLIGVGLFCANELIYRSAGLTQHSPEYVTFFVHVMFSLFVSLMYKAMSVPPPLPD